MGQRSQTFSQANDAILSTNYLDDYAAKGQAFDVQKRFAFTTLNEVQKFMIDFSGVPIAKTPIIEPIQFSGSAGAFELNTYFVADASKPVDGTPIAVTRLSQVVGDDPATVVKSGVTYAGDTTYQRREYQAGSAGNPAQSRGGVGSGLNPLFLGRDYVLIIEAKNLYNGANSLELGLLFVEAGDRREGVDEP